MPVPAQGAGLSGLPVTNLYDEFVNLNEVLTPEQIEAYKVNKLTTMSPALAVILTIVTLGIFAWIYYPLQHSKFPKVREDDPSGAKAFWFQWIPLFNIYWYFVVYPRLVDRINFQYRLRGYPAPVNRQLPIWAFVGWCVSGIVGAVVDLMVISQSQSAINRVAAEHSVQLAAPQAG
jgi:hypothetical protein